MPYRSVLGMSAFAAEGQFLRRNLPSALQITAIENSAFSLLAIYIAVTQETERQIGDHSDIEQQHDNSWGADSFRELVDFKRQKRRRGDNREILCPTLSQQKTCAFGQQERRVKEGADAKLPQFAIVESQEFFQQAAEVVAIGIDAENVRPVFHLEGQVLMQQFRCTDSHGKEDQALGKLKSCNDLEAA